VKPGKHWDTSADSSFEVVIPKGNLACVGKVSSSGCAICQNRV